MDGFQFEWDTSKLPSWLYNPFHNYENVLDYFIKSMKHNTSYRALIEIGRPDLCVFIEGSPPHFETLGWPMIKAEKVLTLEELALIERAMWIHFQEFEHEYGCFECESNFRAVGVDHQSGRDFRML